MDDTEHCAAFILVRQHIAPVATNRRWLAIGLLEPCPAQYLERMIAARHERCHAVGYPEVCRYAVPHSLLIHLAHRQLVRALAMQGPAALEHVHVRYVVSPQPCLREPRSCHGKAG